ncbi:MAG: hypothetical protein V4659_10820 [Pseudomonadota bacterium]
MLFAVGATAQPGPRPRTFWTGGFNQGIAEYSTGTFDQAIDAGVRIACLPNGSATIAVQIKGVAPAAGQRLRLIPTTRRASRAFDFRAGPDGTIAVPRAARSPQFRQLWAALRSGDTLTVRYADESFAVLSLVGAAATLPVRVCGK